MGYRSATAGLQLQSTHCGQTFCQIASVTPTIFSIHLPLVRHNVSNQYVITSHINIRLFGEYRTVLTMKTQHDHYDRLSVRLSVIISRLLAGQSLELKALANKFGVSERTLQRDFQQRLIMNR